MTPHLLLLCIIAQVAIVLSASEIDCIVEDFQDGNSALFSGSCSTVSGENKFDVLAYDELFEGPEDNNGFYATSFSGARSCIRYREKITVTDSVKFTLKLFKSSEIDKSGMCFVFAIDASTGDGVTLFDHKILKVDSNRGWEIEELIFDKLEDGDTIWLEILCEDLKAKNSFLAIDYIEIGLNNADDCKQITTTTTEPDPTTTPEPDPTTTTEPDPTTTTEPDTTTTPEPDTTTTPEPDTTTTPETDTTTTSEPHTTSSIDPEVTTEDSETTSDDSTIETTTDTTLIPSIPKPPKDPKKMQRLMGIIGVGIGSGLTIWLIVLTVFVIRVTTSPVVSRVGVKDDVGMAIPRLQVQKVQVDEVGKCVIDISGVESKK